MPSLTAGSVAFAPTPRQLVKYWRTCVSDEDLMGADHRGARVITALENIRNSALDEYEIEELFTDWNRNKQVFDSNASSARSDGCDRVPVLIFARTLLRKHAHGKPEKDGADVSECPLLLAAFLTREGQFEANSEVRPWIGREHLYPTDEGDHPKLLVGKVSDLDEWMDKTPYDPLSWGKALDWCDGLWEFVTTRSPSDSYSVVDEARVIAFRSIKSGGFHITRLYDELAALPEAQTPSLFRRICEGKHERLALHRGHRIARLAAARGSMTTEFALAQSQADALAAYTMLKEGEVLAVNGPPGTGKTALLQAIVASEVVRSAIEGVAPAVIVGVGATNQSIKNINESMNNIAKPRVGAPVWAQRWVSEAQSFGLYLPSAEEAKKNLKEPEPAAYALREGKTWSGFHEKENDDDYIAQANETWLSNARLFLGSEDIESGLGSLQKRLKATMLCLGGWQKLMTNLEKHRTWWDAHAPGMAPAQFIANAKRNQELAVAAANERVDRARIAITQEDGRRQTAERRMYDEEQEGLRILAAARTEINEAVATKALVLEAASPKGLMEVLLEPIPLLCRAVNTRKLSRLYGLAQGEPRISEQFGAVLASGSVPQWIEQSNQLISAAQLLYANEGEGYSTMTRRHERERQELNDARAVSNEILRREQSAKASLESEHANRIANLQAKLAELESCEKAATQNYNELVERARAAYSITNVQKVEPPRSPSASQVEQLLDRTYRYHAFQLAARYWEGRWLQEVQNGFAGVKGQEAVTGRLRRWCMLTPCIVVTMHSLPKHITFPAGKVEGSRPDEGWIREHLFAFIDLLIVDEAGQAAPHIGAAGFALAKRAVVVGDIYQIEPVVKITRGIDHGNSVKAGLEKLWVDGEHSSPLLVSEPIGRNAQGSVMLLAQRATAATHPDQTDAPGIFLSEHRRCHSDIIGFCNDLVYGGKLVCMTANPSQPPPLPPLLWVDVRGHTEKRNSSLSNKKEAEAIAAWIDENAASFGSTYVGKPIEQIVAVITPFRAQAELIRTCLGTRNRALRFITVGTVHALQGAQRPIIVFSSTCSDETSPTLFADRKVNMLNVAVSRAMHSFVAFGDMRLYRRSGRSPTSVLGRRLFGKGREAQVATHIAGAAGLSGNPTGVG